MNIAAINKASQEAWFAPNKLLKNSLFGNKINPAAPNNAPKNRYGNLLPNFVKVLSESAPIIG